VDTTLLLLLLLLLPSPSCLFSSVESLIFIISGGCSIFIGALGGTTTVAVVSIFARSSFVFVDDSSSTFTLDVAAIILF